MSEANQGNNPDASAIVPVKRKRGRPRKYPRPDPNHGGNAHASRNQNPNHGGSSRVPPGFVRVNGNQPRQEDPVIDANDVMVGQVVHGVIEAAFDAGYLLSVRVGNSETTLRGVVFKPGHYVPVSADNDVAPGVQMIRRNEIQFPRENNPQVHSHNRSRERNGTVHAPRATNPVVPKIRQQVPSVGSQSSSPGISRGNVVPVVLQPIDLSNGVAGELSSVATQPAHAVGSKGKQALDAAQPSNGSPPANQLQAIETQLLHFQSQNNHQVMSTGIQKEAGLNQNSAEAAGMPFEKLLTEVIKRTQVPSPSKENNTSSTVKSCAEDDDSSADLPLSVEPLQSVQPVLNNHPAVLSRPLENYRTGKMTELLQENMPQNQVTVDPRMKEDELGPETEHGDEDGGNSMKHSQASSV
ncbi:uncharacterized protein LOC105632949 isoform X2 [Jatropha curcas]|uniref:uncharacterized protein LOC105632949 isoform X2 n=1 Tax=Jatropha curcas TaxID=180498 RepID=UPI0005FB428B|nr:uncharacterized protein LOC105632949 isoform X2 [Jatropha curcas]